MNEVRLLNKLHEDLDDELSWRKKEITTLLLHIESQKGDLQVSLIRGAITLLYAHWEGFIKISSIKYLQYVCDLDYTLGELTDNFCYITLGQKFPNHEVSTNIYDWQKKIFDYVYKQHQEDKLKINPRLTIKSRGNLNYATFEEICQQVGVDISWYETKENFLDERLLGLRNPIAHGEFRSHSKLIEDFREIKNEILKFLEVFKDLIVDASERKKFLRVPNRA